MGYFELCLHYIILPLISAPECDMTPMCPASFGLNLIWQKTGKKITCLMENGFLYTNLLICRNQFPFFFFCGNHCHNNTATPPGKLMFDKALYRRAEMHKAKRLPLTDCVVMYLYSKCRTLQIWMKYVIFHMKFSIPH